VGPFSKSSAPAPRDASQAIGAFWRWWRSSAPGLADAIADGILIERASEIAGLVDAIDPGLTWEFGPGTSSEHTFAITAAGNPALRRVARSWLLAAPPADETWAFYDMRQPGPLDNALRVGRGRLVIDDVRVQVERCGNGLDVVVYHPAMKKMPTKVCGEVAFLCLDHALGEESVELWVGSVDYSQKEPKGTIPIGELRRQVDELAAEVRPDGEMGWTMLQGSHNGSPVIVRCLSRLRPIQAPMLDQHVAVSILFDDRTPAGLPGPECLEALQDFEDRLTETLGDAGQPVAIETSDGNRTIHLYVDSATTAVTTIEAAARTWVHSRIEVTTAVDPGWEAVCHFAQ